MKNDQIQSLDKCRDFNKMLNKASGEIKSALIQVNSYSNNNKGKELQVLAKELEKQVWVAIVECQKGIDKIISEI